MSPVRAVRRGVAGLLLLALGLLPAACVDPGGAAGGRGLVLEGFGRPEALALDAHGVLYVTDAARGEVVCVFADGQRTALGGLAGAPRGLAVDGRGRVYAVDAAGGLVVRLEPDGTRRVLARGLPEPAALALDRDGGLFVACRGDGTVRRLPPS